MNSLQSIDIFGFKSGAQQKNKKPFLLVDDAFVDLQNCYVWREEVRKREGLQFIGRYRRVFATAAFGNTNFIGGPPETWTILNIYSTYKPPITKEATAEIEHGSVIITIGVGPGAIVLTDQGNGLLTSNNPDVTGYINYLNGDIVITNEGVAIAPTASTASFAYFPGLPAMGIIVREIAGVNNEQTLWFDTKYCYINLGNHFEEFLPTDASVPRVGVTWDGSNSDFFWGTNYRGSEAQLRLFFVTNFVLSAGSPMRYTNGTTWEEFKPSLGGQQRTDVLSTTLASGSAAFGPAVLTNLPILEGTVVITVTHNVGSEDDIVFRDTPKDGTLVSSGLNTGTINYATGDITLSFNPVLPGSGNWTVTAVYQQAGTFLFTARILIPYYGRLLALNTYEGTSIATAVNIFNRCRFSQIGNPVQQDAWRTDVFGKGGFIDAPTNEQIVNATFYKNTLIVFFERSTWRLQYLGEYGLPFIWERISSDYGSESTFSPVLFDNGVLAVGDKAIVGSSGGDVQRIDLDIPDEVYKFRNNGDGTKRVHGIRDFKKEIVYWCYNSYPDNQIVETQLYPNKTLLYNYRNNTFAFYRNTVTCFGYFQYLAGISWDRLDVYWDSYNVSWDSPVQPEMPTVVSGNQQGVAHFYGYTDAETGADSDIDAIDQESLSVTAVTVGAVVTLTILDHNLMKNEFIYLTGLNYVVTTSPATAGSTTLNDQIYMTSVVDKDNIILFKWDIEEQQAYSDFVVTNVGTYVGGGVVALFPRLRIETKDFNPMKQGPGFNIKTSSIDFLFDASSPSPINVNMMMNTSANAQGNLLIGNNNVETSNSKTGFVLGASQSNPCVIESKNHGLLNGAAISFEQVGGMTQLNGNSYTVTFLTTNTFSLNVDSTAFTTYTSGGYWEQENEEFFTLTSEYAWHRFFSTCFGQYLRLILSYNNDQMSQLSTHQQNFVLNAMKIWYRPGGRNIFGK